MIAALGSHTPSVLTSKKRKNTHIFPHLFGQNNHFLNKTVDFPNLQVASIKNDLNCNYLVESLYNSMGELRKCLSLLNFSSPPARS